VVFFCGFDLVIVASIFIGLNQLSASLVDSSIGFFRWGLLFFFNLLDFLLQAYAFILPRIFSHGSLSMCSVFVCMPLSVHSLEKSGRWGTWAYDRQFSEKGKVISWNIFQKKENLRLLFRQGIFYYQSYMCSLFFRLLPSDFKMYTAFICSSFFV